MYGRSSVPRRSSSVLCVLRLTLCTEVGSRYSLLMNVIVPARGSLLSDDARQDELIIKNSVRYIILLILYKDSIRIQLQFMFDYFPYLQIGRIIRCNIEDRSALR